MIKYLKKFTSPKSEQPKKKWQTIEELDNHYEKERQTFINDNPELNIERRVDKLKSFNASGSVYNVTSSLPIRRYEIFEQQQIKVAYKMSIPKMFDQLRKIYDLNEQGKTNEIAVIVHNLLTAVKDIGNEHNPLLVICTLYIVKEGEDLSDWSQELCDAKIEDWKNAGISMESFFSLALVTISTSMNVYEGVSRTTLEEKKKIAQILSDTVTI